jgi:hypothetical protein
VTFTLDEIEKRLCFPKEPSDLGVASSVAGAAGLVSVPTDIEHVLRLRAEIPGNAQPAAAVEVDWIRLEVVESLSVGSSPAVTGAAKRLKSDDHGAVLTRASTAIAELPLMDGKNDDGDLIRNSGVCRPGSHHIVVSPTGSDDNSGTLATICEPEARAQNQLVSFRIDWFHTEPTDIMRAWCRHVSKVRSAGRTAGDPWVVSRARGFHTRCVSRLHGCMEDRR